MSDPMFVGAVEEILRSAGVERLMDEIDALKERVVKVEARNAYTQKVGSNQVRDDLPATLPYGTLIVHQRGGTARAFELHRRDPGETLAHLIDEAKATLDPMPWDIPEDAV